MAETNLEIAVRIQDKFHFYLVGLAFTVLGLSVQTAKFGGTPTSDISELIGWFCLLVSGLAGLSRIESTPRIYKLADQQDSLSEGRNELMEARVQGPTARIKGTTETVPLDKLIETVEDRRKPLAQRIDALNKKAILKYKIHKYTLVLGLVALALSRGYVPAQQLLIRLLAGGP